MSNKRVWWLRKRFNGRTEDEIESAFRMFCKMPEIQMKKMNNEHLRNGIACIDMFLEDKSVTLKSVSEQLNLTEGQRKKGIDKVVGMMKYQGRRHIWDPEKSL